MRRPAVTPAQLNTARALRREGKSIRQISETMGVPRSTVGDWLKGFGERGTIETCWCGQAFIARSTKARSCCTAHTQKRWKIYGPIDHGR